MVHRRITVCPIKYDRYWHRQWHSNQTLTMWSPHQKHWFRRPDYRPHPMRPAAVRQICRLHHRQTRRNQMPALAEMLKLEPILKAIDGDRSQGGQYYLN